MRIRILGAGCPRCRALSENVERAVKEYGLDVQVEKVTDLMEIMKSGVLSTPALEVDGEIKSAGKVLSPREIAEMVK